MKGKLFKMVTALMVSAALLAGCSSAKAPASSGNDSGTTAEAKNSGESSTIKMTWLSTGTEPQDLGKIQDKLCEMTMEKLNCKVELVPVSFADQATKYNMWFANGTNIDIMITVFQDYVSMINAGAFMEMDELLTVSGQDILKKDEEKNFLSAGVYKGKQYGIPTIPSAPGNGGSLYVRKDVYDLLDTSAFDTKDYIDYEDMDNLFAQIKEKCPEYTAYGVMGDTASSGTYYFYLKNFDNLGVAGGSSGVLLNPMENTTVENLFASDSYKEYLDWMRKWYQDGYISKDAATSTESADTMFKAGRTATMVSMSTSGFREGIVEQAGIDVVQLDLCPNYMTTNVYTGCMFFIPKNSQNPEKAMEFLNYLFTDADVQNLLSFGIKDEHYTVQDNGLVIEFTQNREKYVNPFGVWGDQSQQFLTAPQTPDLLEAREKYLQVSLDHTSKAFGYQFDGTAVSTEQSTVKSVIAKYMTQLEYGTVDVEEVYPEFLKALEDAGIEKIIQENQRQLNEWMKQ